MIGKFGALSPLGWLGWLIVAVVWVWLIRSIRKGPFTEDYQSGAPVAAG